MAGLPPGMSKQEAAMHVDAYMEYRNLVGDTDGGAPLPEREYEELRRKAAKAKQNELFVFFRNSKGLDCRAAGPSSRCFCTHRYRDHAWFEVDTKRVKCRMAGCPCKCYQLIPVQGSQDIKCRQCRHSFEDHKADPKLMKACGKPNCRCSCFTAVWSCSCGETWEDHQTVFETRRERLASGLPVDRPNPHSLAPMGGITDYQSLAGGVDRVSLFDASNVYAALEGGDSRPALQDSSKRGPAGSLPQITGGTVSRGVKGGGAVGGALVGGSAGASGGRGVPTGDVDVTALICEPHRLRESLNGGRGKLALR